MVVFPGFFLIIGNIIVYLRRTIWAIGPLFLAAHYSIAASNPHPGWVVILDPGHGGKDVGASLLSKPQITEKDLTLRLALKTAKILKSHGVQVKLTRTADQTLALDERTKKANQMAMNTSSALFVSIHLNSSPNKHSSGIETYVFNAATNEASARLAEIENGPVHNQILHPEAHGPLDLILTDLTSTANYADSVALACSIQRHASIPLKLKDRGVHQALFYVLMQTKMPSVLIEAGFLSHSQDRKRLLAADFQQKLAFSLSQGIINWIQLTENNKLSQPSILSGLSGIHKSPSTRPCLVR